MDVKTYELTHKKSEKSFECIGIDGKYIKYFCWNQNGFNNALYDHFAGEYITDNNKKSIRRQARGCYPKHYPCIILIDHYNTFEAGFLIAEFEYE